MENIELISLEEAGLVEDSNDEPLHGQYLSTEGKHLFLHRLVL
jgi:hypothetical protein